MTCLYTLSSQVTGYMEPSLRYMLCMPSREAILLTTYAFSPLSETYTTVICTELQGPEMGCRGKIDFVADPDSKLEFGDR